MSMNTTACPRRSQIDWITHDGLSPVARLLGAALDRAPRLAGEAWWGNERLAKALGKAVSTIQRALKELALAGLVEVVADYSLKTRRRIVLLWRKPAEPAAQEPQAAPAPEETMPHAADLRRDLAPRRVEPAAPAAAPVDRPRGGVPAAAAPEGRKATPEEVRALVTAALELQSATPDGVRKIARKLGVDTLRKAVDYAKRTGKRRWGLAVHLAKQWRETGVPDYARDEDEARREAIHRLFGPGGKYERPTIDMTPYLGIRLDDD